MSTKKVIGYLQRWTVYRPGDSCFDLENIDPNLCSHLIYSFAGLSDECTIMSLDPWMDLPDNFGHDGFRRFNDLKGINPSLKTMIAIGGWNEGSEKYSRLLGVPANRTRFVQDVVPFLKRYGFDGLDINWEYPGQRGGKPEDIQTFNEWIKELRTEFDKNGLILSAGVPATEASFSQSYDVPTISKYLDFINLMTNDLLGPWDSKTEHNAPLYSYSSANQLFNVDASVKAWIANGALAEKLVMGVAAYGRTWTLSSTDCINVGCPASGPGAEGSLTGKAGFLGYNEISIMENEAGAKLLWDDQAKASYMVRNNQWAGYDNEKSLENKIDYIKKNKLAGAMISSIDTDDFRGNGGKGKNPLLTTLKNGLL